MRKGAKLLIAGALCGAMAGCAGLDPTPMDDADLYTWDLDAVKAMAAQGSAFSHGLRLGYLDLNEREYNDFDFADADHYARKAVQSARGLFVQPDQVSLRELTPEQVDRLTAARARLMAGLEENGRVKAPMAAARAQTFFDCWLEEEEENHEEGIARCRAGFEQAMAEVEEALASDIDDVFIVFFAWDRANITPVAREVIENVAEVYEEGDPARLILAGHADTSGPADYNVGLSERRARAVAAELVNLGVPEEALDIEWFGETMPRVETGDGVREPQNRRVEITFSE